MSVCPEDAAKCRRVKSTSGSFSMMIAKVLIVISTYATETFQAFPKKNRNIFTHLGGFEKDQQVFLDHHFECNHMHRPTQLLHPFCLQNIFGCSRTNFKNGTEE